MGQPTSGRAPALDLLRAYAIIQVVLAHAAAPPLYEFGALPRAHWWAANLFDSFGRASVPLFLMVSGYLLLDPAKDESLGEFFRKRVAKLLVPYCFWAAFYFWWRQSFHGEALDAFQVGRLFLGGTPYFHLYYIPVILGMYLLTPVLRVVVKHAPPTTLAYLLALWFALTSLLPLFSKLSGLDVNDSVQVTPAFLGYYLLGGLYRVSAYRPRRAHLAGLAAGLVAGVLLTAGLTWAFTKRAGALDEFFYTNASPTVVLMAVASFPLLLALFSHPAFGRLPVVPGALRQVGLCSFGLFFLHMAALEWLGRDSPFPLRATTCHPLLAVPLLTALVVAGGTALVYLARRVPVLRGVVP